ncbi:MAG: hypothetical protein ACRCUY_04790 [Thermoguttaceae bacterium]
MNFNFFDWVRDGVKRSVLLGVSDAVQTMGMPHDEEASKERILSFLQDDSGNGVQRRRVSGLPSGPSATAKKLGRSINDIHLAKEAS